MDTFPDTCGLPSSWCRSFRDRRGMAGGFDVGKRASMEEGGKEGGKKRMGRGSLQDVGGGLTQTSTLLFLLCLLGSIPSASPFALPPPSSLAPLHRPGLFLTTSSSANQHACRRGWTCALERADSRGSTPVGVGRGNLRLLEGVPFALGMAKRRVWVWTPDGYESGGGSFPVVYCQDGQNKMDSER